MLTNDVKEESVLLDNGNDTFNGAEWSAGVGTTRIQRDKCVHFDKPMTLTFNTKWPGYDVISFDLLVRDSPTVTIEVHSDSYGTYKVQYTSTSGDSIWRSGRTM